MFHRILINQKINDWYVRRGMAVSLNSLFSIIDEYLNKGYIFGTIKDCINSRHYFHLAFDDGFKEHLECAILLKEKYDIKYDHMTFSINIGNSYLGLFSGMDLIYYSISNGLAATLTKFLNISEKRLEPNNIKQVVASLKPNYLSELSSSLKEIHSELKNQFLNEIEVLELSQLFQIASHGIIHRFLTEHQNCSGNEILESKLFLEKKLGRVIEIFCYPEGKNNEYTQTFVREAGFKYALSIRHDSDNNYCIGRKVF